MPPLPECAETNENFLNISQQDKIWAYSYDQKGNPLTMTPKCATRTGKLR
jgi:hypothetical protein